MLLLILMMVPGNTSSPKQEDHHPVTAGGLSTPSKHSPASAGQVSPMTDFQLKSTAWLGLQCGFPRRALKVAEVLVRKSVTLSLEYKCLMKLSRMKAYFETPPAGTGIVLALLRK